MSATASASSRRLGTTAWRVILLLHRYLGIGLGLVVLLWCTSGMIMMYVQYPTLDHGEQLAGLSPLEPAACCASPERTQDAVLELASWRVESGLGHLWLRATLTNGMPVSFDLTDGQLVERWTEPALDRFGASFAAATSGSTVTATTWVDRNQWTVHGRFDAHRPLRKLTNAAGDEWYLSSRTGEIVQATTATERFWNWPGAVTHWIYPTALRQHTGAWAQVVIWLTIVSLILTITGVAIGIRQFRWRGNRRRSPYRGWWLWHHYTGLAFGLMTLIWLGSGLLSMNPWGALEGRSIDAERSALNGLDHTLAGAVSAVRLLRPLLPPDTVRLEAASWLAAPYFLAWNADGEAVRLSEHGLAPPITEKEVLDAAILLARDGGQVDFLDQGDDYYFTHHETVELPVYRIVTPSRERFYLSALSGRLLAQYDEDRRWYRWLFEGLHRGDFHAALRARPLWDVVLLALMAGVTAGVATGVYLAWRRVRPR